MTKIKLLDGFDDWLLEHESRERISHYSSNAGSCTRRMYWDWTGKEKSNPPTPGAILKMEFGNAAEWIFSRYLKDAKEKEYDFAGYKITNIEEQWKERFPVEGLEYPVTCKLDYVLTLDGYGDVGVELKSMFGQGIVNIARTGQPKDSYLEQIKMYTTLTPFKKFCHPYLGRDNGYRAEFFLVDHPDGLQCDFDTVFPVDVEKSFDSFRAVERHLKEKTIPPRDYIVAIKDGDIKDKFTKDKKEYKSDWQCSYCDYRNDCWREMCIKYSSGSNIEMFKEKEYGVEKTRETISEW